VPGNNAAAKVDRYVASILELYTIYNLCSAICQKAVIPNRMNMRRIVTSDAAPLPQSPLHASLGYYRKGRINYGVKWIG